MDDRRERRLFWAIVAALLAATGAAYALILGPPPGEREPVLMFADEPSGVARDAADSAGASVPAAPFRLALSHVAGEVTLVRAGVATPARPGDSLHEEDAVVTGAGARVEIAGGPYAVALEEVGRLEIGKASPELSALRLDAGFLSARVAKGVLEIAAAPGASVRSEAGALSVARDGGSLAAGVLEGSGVLRSAGGAVALAPGEQSIAAEARPPTLPAPIASSLPLHVKWPVRRTTKRSTVVVTGRTAPGATVAIGAERAQVGPDGRFTLAVTLSEGEQRLCARARAVGGLEATVEGPVVVRDTRAPGARFKTRDLWGKQ